jgi:hypothetical protein
VGHGSLSSRDSASWAAAGGPGGTLDKTQIQDYSPENLERIQRGKETRDGEVQRLRNPEEAEQGHIPLAPLNFADIAAIQARQRGEGLLGQALLLALLSNSGTDESQGGFVVGWQWMSCLAARHPSTSRAVRATDGQQEDGEPDTPRLLSGGYRRDQ